MNRKILQKDIIGGIIPIISAGAAAAELGYNARSVRQDSNAKFIQIFKQMDIEISECENS